MGEQPSIELLPKQHKLLEQLVLAGQELSGQDLHARLRGTPLAMGLATVYRHLPSGEALFATTERDEHHLTCVDCGRTQPLTACPIHDAHLSPEQIGGFQLLFHTLEFFGLCSDCQGRQDQG